MSYALPYLIVFFIFAVLAVIYAQRCDKEEDKALCSAIQIISIVAFYIFFAFRGYVFTDWIAYKDYYENATWSGIFNLVDEKNEAIIIEPGFSLLMCICKLVSDEYAFLVIVITTIDLFLLLRFAKRYGYDNIPFVMMLFFTFNGISIMFNLMRNQLAIFLFLNLIQYIEEKKPGKYYLGCFAALCFHTSSLLFFPMYFIMGRKINRWVFISAFAFMFLFYMVHGSVVKTIFELFGSEGTFAAKARAYTEMFSESTAFSITGTIEKFGLVALIFTYYDQLTEKKINIIMINSLLICYFFYYIFSEFSMMSYRMFLLFQFPYWFIWIDILSHIEIQGNRRIYNMILFTYCFYFHFAHYKQPVEEYDNLLFGAKSQAERIYIREKTHEKPKL